MNKWMIWGFFPLFLETPPATSYNTIPASRRFKITPFSQLRSPLRSKSWAHLRPSRTDDRKTWIQGYDPSEDSPYADGLWVGCRGAIK